MLLVCSIYSLKVEHIIHMLQACHKYKKEKRDKSLISIEAKTIALVFFKLHNIYFQRAVALQRENISAMVHLGCSQNKGVAQTTIRMVTTIDLSNKYKSGVGISQRISLSLFYGRMPWLLPRLQMTQLEESGKSQLISR